MGTGDAVVWSWCVRGGQAAPQTSGRTPDAGETYAAATRQVRGQDDPLHVAGQVCEVTCRHRPLSVYPQV
jgi:hypothetical protein